MEFNKTTIELIRQLEERNSQTVEELAVSLNVSKRTVYKLLNEKDIFHYFGVEVINKDKIGYSLVIKNQEKYARLHNQKSQDSRTHQLIALLIEQNDYMRIEDIADTLYVSRASIDRLLIKIKDILETYNLSLKTKQKKGIKICEIGRAHV